jgi:glycosyltransferase involved in cell wall biosynthesis
MVLRVTVTTAATEKMLAEYSNDKIRVLVLLHSAALGGASRSAATVMDRLRKAGCEVFVLAPPGPLCSVFERMGATVAPWQPPACQWFGRNIVSSGVPAASFNTLASQLLSLAMLPGRLGRGVRLIRDIVTRESITTIFVNSLVLFPVARVLAGIRQERRLRVLWQIREVLNERLAKALYIGIVKGIARASDVIMAISTNEACPFQSLAAVEIVHNAVPLEWALMEEEAQKEDSSERRVIMTCDFNSGKGIVEFLAMSRIVRKRCPEAEFILYTPHPSLHGGPTSLLLGAVGFWNDKVPLVARMVAEARELVLGEGVRIIFDFAIDMKTYREAAVYVRADRAGCPWGRDVIEAMWAGLPVVATGTSQEFVLDGETGFLVPPAREDLLADRVCDLLADPELRRRMAGASRARAITLFSPNIFTAQIRRLFSLGSAGVGGST